MYTTISVQHTTIAGAGQLVSRQTIYQITGFDRPNFVGDVARAVPEQTDCRITGLVFEGDGIRVDGQLTVLHEHDAVLADIDRQLRAIRGVVSIRQTN
jgi:predicted short-subunit dehydrogenase-like oxidoreductase (DUF2520 family)